VTSHVTDSFRTAFRKLPERVQRQALQAYRRWSQDPQHPSLHFKQVHVSKPIYSVRVALGWRALGIREGDTMVWFWIGSHADYERLLKE
jgi:hypothetical protein